MARNTFNKKSKKKAILALSLACVSAFSMCFFSACDDDDTDKDSSSTTKTDEGMIANGDFEYYTDDDNLKLVVSPASWSKSVGTDGNSNSAASSAKASGIVNTETSVWNEMTTSSYVPTDLDDAEKNWEKMTAKDRLDFYARLDDGEFEDDDVEKASEFELYEDYAYSIDADDLPTTENPGTHDKGVYTSTGDDDKSETSVLMIHNYRTDGYGTAQKYTSSTTVTLEANTSATFSVWVKTQDLTYNNGVEVTSNRGAYISVTQTVGGTAIDQTQIKNINTAGVTENNGWEQYTVYLKGCSYASSTFNIVLGLGQGSTSNRYEYVDGYAFFDDIECEKITNDKYDELVAQHSSIPTAHLFSDKNDKLFAVDKAYKGNKAFAIDLYQGFSSFDIESNTVISADLTKETYNGISYTTTNYKGLGISTANDVTAVGSLTSLEAINNSYLKTVLNNDFSKFPFADNEQIIMLLSAEGAAYTAEMKPTSDIFTVEPDEYKMVSFWTKTSALDGYTGATITLVDGDSKTSIGSIDSTIVETVDIDDEEDLFDGWAQCFFFVSNSTKESQSFSLNFSYGPTSITGTTKANYLEGYAAFTGFETYAMNEEEFSYATSGERTAIVSLTGKKTVNDSNGFDQTIYSNTDAIEEGMATPLNFIGVDGGSSFVGGSDYSYANSNDNAGLINKNYKENYSNNYEAANWLYNLLNIEGYKATSLTQALNTSSWWNEIFGTSTQPLLIVNAVEQSYGYIARSASTMSTSSYTSISLNVKVSKGAVAYVYLIDTTSLKDGYSNTVSIETPEVTYWYDDEGNICVKDPSDDDFDSKKDIAYLINKNGLYESVDKADTNLYANLSAYETAYENDSEDFDKESNAGKNLVTADGDIVFYYYDGSYYAQYDEEKNEYLLRVTDLDKKYARYEKESKDLFTVVDNRDGSLTSDWVNVAFYVATGDRSISYRLEVFSGSRDGSVKSLPGSYVAFDSVNPSSLSDSYDGLLEEVIDKLDKADNGVSLDDETGRLLKEDGSVYENAMYYTYTFYDSADYLRYDEYADPANDYILYENESDDPGNLYSSYQQSAQEEQLAYLYYEDEASYLTFVNYTSIDTGVTAETPVTDADEDEDEEISTDTVLMIISLILSIVLVFTMICLIVRRIVQHYRRANVNRDNVYNAKRRHYAKKLKIETEEFDDEIN